MQKRKRQITINLDDDDNVTSNNNNTNVIDISDFHEQEISQVSPPTTNSTISLFSNTPQTQPQQPIAKKMKLVLQQTSSSSSSSTSLIPIKIINQPIQKNKNINLTFLSPKTVIARALEKLLPIDLTQEEKPDFLGILPMEILFEHIFIHLNCVDLVHLSLTAKHWLSLLKTIEGISSWASVLWNKMYIAEFHPNIKQNQINSLRAFADQPHLKLLENALREFKKQFRIRQNWRRERYALVSPDQALKIYGASRGNWKNAIFRSFELICWKQNEPNVLALLYNSSVLLFDPLSSKVVMEISTVDFPLGVRFAHSTNSPIQHDLIFSVNPSSLRTNTISPSTFRNYTLLRYKNVSITPAQTDFLVNEWKEICVENLSDIRCNWFVPTQGWVCGVYPSYEPEIIFVSLNIDENQNETLRIESKLERPFSFVSMSNGFNSKSLTSRDEEWLMVKQFHLKSIVTTEKPFYMFTGDSESLFFQLFSIDFSTKISNSTNSTKTKTSTPIETTCERVTCVAAFFIQDAPARSKLSTLNVSHERWMISFELRPSNSIEEPKSMIFHGTIENLIETFGEKKETTKTTTTSAKPYSNFTVDFKVNSMQMLEYPMCLFVGSFFAVTYDLETSTILKKFEFLEPKLQHGGSGLISTIRDYVIDRYLLSLVSTHGKCRIFDLISGHVMTNLPRNSVSSFVFSGSMFAFLDFEFHKIWMRDYRRSRKARVIEIE